MKAIYEVRIDVDQAKADEYEIWLRDHIAKIVEAAGFLYGDLYRESEPPAGRVVWVSQYVAPSMEIIEQYLAHHAALFRADGVSRFAGHFEISRRILSFQERVPDLTEPSTDTQIVGTHRKDKSMNTQVNWQKIRSEIERLADVDALKTEVQRIGTEIRNFDLQTVLSPKAQAKMKAFEKRYTVLMRTISTAQRQIDRELNKVLRQVKVRRADVNKVVSQQRMKLEKASNEFRKRFLKKTKTAKKKAATAPRKRASKKA